MFYFFGIHFGAMTVLLGAMIYLVASLLSGVDINMMKAFEEAWPGIFSVIFSHGYSFQKNYIEGVQSIPVKIMEFMIEKFFTHKERKCIRRSDFSAKLPD